MGKTKLETKEGHLGKRCTECCEWKTLDEYSRSKNGAGGRQSNCKLCKALKDKKYQQRNSKRIKEYYQSWRNNNLEYDLQRKKDYYEINKEKESKRKKNWVSNNPEKNKVRILRRAARAKDLPVSLNSEDIKLILNSFNYSCALSEKSENIHIDHVIPISSGHGGSVFGNLIPLHATINLSKQDKNFFEWFDRNKERFNLSQTKFDALIEYLAEINEVLQEDYRDHVYWCHENPIDLSEDDVV